MRNAETKPDKFAGIIGQRVSGRVLSHLVDSGRLPGTLLFSGPGGVGKFATALELAKLLHCSGGKTHDCQCRACTAIRTGTHPDVIVLSRDKRIGVDEMREMVALAQLKSASGQERVVIFDRAENITVPAANAALKTFEEPGEHLRFILITDTPAALLPTVRSRSYNLRFSQISSGDMENFAMEVGDVLSDNDTINALRFGAGRPGMYLRWKHTPGYRETIHSVTAWMESIREDRGQLSVEKAIIWKKHFWDYAEELASVERRAGLPRGGNMHDIRKFLESGGKYEVSPINWKADLNDSVGARWGQGRKALLLAGLIRRIMSMDRDARSINAVVRIEDAMQKLRFNCNFDITLERLYFGLAGFKG